MRCGWVGCVGASVRRCVTTPPLCELGRVRWFGVGRAVCVRISLSLPIHGLPPGSARAAVRVPLLVLGLQVGKGPAS